MTDHTQLLANDTLALRALEPTDLDTLYRWENDTSLWDASATAAPYSRQALWQYLQSAGDLYAQRQLRLVIELLATHEAIGTVDFLNFDPLNNHAELGLMIAPEHRARGLGEQAIGLIDDYACRHLGLRQLYVIIASDNEACLQAFQRMHYSLAGTLRSWVRRGTNYCDAVVMQKIF